jgi:hypothetical protein
MRATPEEVTVTDVNGERSRRFNDTTGALSWNYRSACLHPDRCTCQSNDDQYLGTPHKHYDEPPYECARCGCEGYTPAVHPDLSGLGGWLPMVST